MKTLLFVTLILSTGLLSGQTITGKVLDAATNEALAYVNIGVVGQPRGTITDEDGTFELETAGLSPEATIRFSMIGYVAQIFTIQELTDNNGKIIQLKNVPVQLSEVVVKPGKLRNVGATKSSLRKICGWGGTNLGSGCEIGTKIELGELPVNIKSIHIRIHQQSFDSSLLRLHIRDVVNGMPGEELLTKDILFPITKESGWEEIDLSEYNLVFQGDIIASLEWVDVKSIKKLIRVGQEGKRLPPNAVILFKMHKNQSFYGKWGSEALWVRHDDGAPCFYLTVR